MIELGLQIILMKLREVKKKLMKLREDKNR